MATRSTSNTNNTNNKRSLVMPVAAAAAGNNNSSSKKAPSVAASLVTASDGSLINPETDTRTSAAFRDRCNLFNVECEEYVVWRKWAPGGEYRLVWRIKNLSDVAQVITYKQPQHKATFFIQFPEPVTLATGNTFDLAINFRPHELTSLRDSIEVSVGKKGALQIQLVAVTPYRQLGVPAKLDMGLVATGVRTHREFAVQNLGTADIDARWEVAEPFSVSPEETKLRPGESQTLTLTVDPSQALALVTRLVCRDINSNTCVGNFNASAVAKFPFVVLNGASEHTVDFGAVFTGQQGAKAVLVDNVSMVPAHFTVVRADSDVVNPFTFSPSHGTIAPGGKIGFSLKFNPQSPGSVFRSVYELRVQGGNTLHVTVCGQSLGANLSLSVTYLDFGDVPVYTNPSAMVSAVVAPNPQTKVVTLRNTSNMPAEYRITQASDGNVFTFDNTTGIVPPQTQRSITVSFLPPSPINYMRRAYILVKDGETSLALDMLGTGYSAKLRPAPFGIEQVRAFWGRISGGLGRCAPEELAVLAEKLRNPELQNLEDEAEVAALGVLAAAKSSAATGGGLGSTFDASSTRKSLAAKSTKSGTSTLAPKMIIAAGRKIDATRGHAMLDELPMLLSPGEAVPLPFSLDEHSLTFRQPGGAHVDEQQIVTVHNHTASKATAVWVAMMAGIGDDGVAREVAIQSTGKTSGKVRHVPWVVSPAVADIPPHGSAQFFVSASRDVGSVTGTFAHFLECFVSFKQMRTFRLVNEDTFSPPVCLVLEVQRLVPMPESAATPEAGIPSTIAFPAQLLNHSTYQVIAIHNMNETQMSFSINIEDNSSRRMLLLASGQEVPYPDNVVEDWGTGGGGATGRGGAAATAAVAGENSNPSPAPINSSSHLPEVSTFTCYPTRGSVAPKQSALIVFRFRPQRRKRYRATAIVSINDVSFGARHISLRGEGFVPQLTLQDHNMLMFRPTAVGARAVREYRIHNPSRVSVEFFFDVPAHLADVFRVEPPGGVLGPNDHTSLQTTFAPGHVQKYEARIPVTVRSPMSSQHSGDGNGGAGCDDETQVFCTAVGEGCTNVLQVEPINLELGEVMCGASTVSEFTIFNVGVCDVYFEVRALMKDGGGCLPVGGGGASVAVVEELDSGAATTDEAATAGDNNSNVKALDLPQLHAAGSAAASLRKQHHHHHHHHSDPEKRRGEKDLPHVLLEPASGFLRGRSHVRVLIKTQLPRRGPGDFAICVVHHGSQQIAQEVTPTLSDLACLPHVNVSVSGSHPTVAFSDVRCTSQRKSRLWRQMSFDSVNAQLALPVEACDLEKESFDFAGAIAGLAPNVCDLGVDVIRTAPIRVLACLRNKSAFPVKFAFWFADQQVGTEDLAELEDADANSASLVADRHLFSIEPRQAEIAPGADVTIVFSYKHCYVGSHATPVILQVDDGKRILLHLTARTLAENEQHLAFHYSREHVFAPVAIGDMEPPLQYAELQNVGYEPVNYVVDQAGLGELREKNGDFPVMQCLNPQGTVPPLSTLLLCWCFRPLEKKKYEATILIHVENNNNNNKNNNNGGEGGGALAYPLKMIGTGYHPAQMPLAEVREIMENKSFAPIPAAATLKHELAPLHLSWDVLKFGVVPMHSLHRRVIVLHNTHPRDTFLFEWNTVMQFGDHIVEMDPPRGRIRPGEKVTSRLSLYAGSTAQLVDLAVSCHVLNEDLRQRRLKARQLRSHRAAENLEAAVGSNADERDALGQDEATAAAKRERNRQRAQQRMPLTTIPPAFQSAKQLRNKIRELTDAAAAEELSEDDPRLVFVDVVPGVVEVLLQAYVLDNESYAKYFGHAPVSFFPTLAAYATPVSAPERLAILGDISSDELALAQDVVAGILQQVVHHKKVRDATADISEDPVPFFYQVAAAPAIEEYRSAHAVAQNMPRKEVAEREAVAAAMKKASEALEAQRREGENTATDGFLRCLTEEVVEQLMFELLGNPRSAGSIVSQQQSIVLRNNVQQQSHE